MRFLQSLTLATLGLVATSVYAAPLQDVSASVTNEQTGVTDANIGKTEYTGAVIIYDAYGNACPNDPTNKLPIVAISDKQFGDFVENTVPEMCSKCVRIKVDTANTFARIIGICEGCGDENLEMQAEEIAKLNGDNNNQFTEKEVVWEIVDCAQAL